MQKLPPVAFPKIQELNPSFQYQQSIFNSRVRIVYSKRKQKQQFKSIKI
jgi:hypothetical protein